jgi:quinohemoprotein ethanol dehydrogenase
VRIGSGIIASPVTYEIDGVQYVSIMAGAGGAGGVSLAGRNVGPPPPGRVLTFALNGKQSLPDLPATGNRVVLPIESAASRETINQGAGLFVQHCSVCHGQDAQGGGSGVPDLRLSQPSVFESYRKILLEGSLANSGMPSFKELLKPDEADAIRAFIISRRAEITTRK